MALCEDGTAWQQVISIPRRDRNAGDLKGRRKARGDCRESEAVANDVRPSHTGAPG